MDDKQLPPDYSRQITLLKHAIQIKDESLDFYSVQNILELPSFPINSALDSKGMTSLMFACYLGKLNIINLLLKKGASPHVLDSHLDNPVVYALRGFKSNLLEVLRLLYQYDANFSYTNLHGESPFDLLPEYRLRNYEDYEELCELMSEFTDRYYSRGNLLKIYNVSRLGLI